MDFESVAIYCRVDQGTETEAQKTAMHIQRRKLEEYAENNGLHISDCYEDSNCSGYSLHRPGLQKLMKDYGSGKFEAVLVSNTSRLLRNGASHLQKWPFEILSLNPLESEWA